MANTETGNSLAVLHKLYISPAPSEIISSIVAPYIILTFEVVLSFQLALYNTLYIPAWVCLLVYLFIY